MLLGLIIGLDERGRQLTSTEFSNLLFSGFEDNGAKVTFVIGAYSGLPDEVRDNYSLISLSKMTWPHQLARLLLTEQIYRATEIRKGSNYHKD